MGGDVKVRNDASKKSFSPKKSAGEQVMEKRDLRCIIPDLFTRRSSPCLLLMTTSTKQFRRSARDLEGVREGASHAGEQVAKES